MNTNENHDFIPFNHALILFKFGKKKYMTKFIEGNVFFSCAGNYVKIAENNGNDEQGDKNEAVFARLKKTDDRINKAINVYGKDLQIIDDGEFVKLRRKSSLFYPLFCMYAYKVSDCVEIAEQRSGYQIVEYQIDNRIFNSFSDSISLRNVLNSSELLASIYMQPRPFVYNLKNKLFSSGYSFRMMPIDYEVKAREIYYIEPTDDRAELFFKELKYQYQHEARVCITNEKFSHIYETLNLNIGKPIEGDMHLIVGTEFYLTHKALLKEIYV